MEKIKIKPVGNRVAIKLIDGEEITDGGIIIPGTNSEKIKKGIVTGIGIDVPQINTGDTVFFSATRYHDVEGTIILNAHDIIAMR
jgi:chaperonin GroES